MNIVDHRPGRGLLGLVGGDAGEKRRRHLVDQERHARHEDLSDQHAIILNRSRDGSILVPGVALLIYEMTPALFACVAANEAEKAAPDAVINDVQMMGATGRIFMSGTLEDMQTARDKITQTLEKIKGRSA